MDIKVGAVLLLLLFGCAAPSSSDTGNTSASPSYTPPEPSFILLSPESSQVFQGEGTVMDVPLVLSTSNFLLHPPEAGKRIGEGHFIVQIDDGEPFRIFTKQYTLRNMESGEHTLSVILVHNDGTPYDPLQEGRVTFMVRLTLPAPTVHEVIIRDFSYEPTNLIIRVSERVTWINAGNSPRTVTSTNNFNSGQLARGQNFTHTFSRAGVYNYFSVNYPSMKGTVTVE